ncbi:MAG TPA: MXAN_2562 family outer membrane beta-barrel protein [Nitrospiria bacterium]|nr:MXAN_2562 family outer membrane beta-barrel protein [Nitrospiria bacterium]
MNIIRGILFVLLILFITASSTQAAAFPSWSFSLKAGAYQPNAAGYDINYGDPRAVRGDLELGYKITRRIEVGLSVGYFMDNGLALGAVSGTPSGVKQKLVLIPTQLYLVYQFAFNDGQIFVPYLGGGYTHITYRRSVEGQGTIMGGKDGYHARAGLKFLLNRLEPSTADKLYQTSGIMNTYFLLEGQYARVNGFDDSSVDLGGWSYFGGLQFEF